MAGTPGATGEARLTEFPMADSGAHSLRRCLQPSQQKSRLRISRTTAVRRGVGFGASSRVEALCRSDNAIGDWDDAFLRSSEAAALRLAVACQEGVVVESPCSKVVFV